MRMRCLVFSICIHKNGLWSAKFNLLSDAASAKQRVLMKNGIGGSIVDLAQNQNLE